MKVLMLSLDKTLFDGNSDAAKRMRAYAELAEYTTVIVFNVKGKFKEIKYSEKLIIYPTNSLFKIFYFFKAYSLVKKINGCNLIISQDPYLTGVIAWLLSLIFKIKLLISIFGNDIFNFFWLRENILRRELKYFAQFILNKADAIQSDNLETVDFLKQKYGEKKVFWKPIVPSEIEQYKKAVKISSPKIRLLTVCRLVKQKNLPMLLQVIDQTLQVKPEVEFTIIGEGPLHNFLQNELKTRQLDTKVKWIHGCKWQDLLDYYLNNDIFILTSLYEGFPRVFQEAMAVGLPIITTRVGKGLIKDGYNGCVVDHNKVKEFVEKIVYLIDNFDKREEFGANSKKYFWDNFSFEKTLSAQALIYSYLSN